MGFLFQHLPFTLHLRGSWEICRQTNPLRPRESWATTEVSGVIYSIRFQHTRSPAWSGNRQTAWLQHTVQSKHKTLKYGKLKECIWQKAVVSHAPFLSALISGQMPFISYKFTVYTFSTKLVCLIQWPVNHYGDDLLRLLFSCHSAHTGMSTAQEKPESTNGWQPCTLSHHACEEVCSKQVPWSVHRRVSTDRTWSPGINRLHPLPPSSFGPVTRGQCPQCPPATHTPACRSAPRTQQVSLHSAISVTKPQQHVACTHRVPGHFTCALEK